MGSIVNSIVGGVSGNAGGAGVNFQGQKANILEPSTVAQANEQYGNVQTGLTQQQQFLNAVQAQNGLQNQSNVYNQLSGVANGTGPNPAQAMLNQQTQANTANQAALMAGQRGSSSNPALIARQAAQQGGNLQQQAVGQGATLQANQSLNALNTMGSLATNQANQQANATNAYSNAAQAANAQVLGGINNQNQAQVGNTNNINSSGAGVSGIVAGQQGNLLGNIVGGAGKALAMAEGGQVPDATSNDHNEWQQLFADGGMATTQMAPAIGASNAPTSRIGQYFDTPDQASNPVSGTTGMSNAGQAIGGGIGSGLNSLFTAASPMSMAGGAGDAGGMSSMAGMMAARGGQVPALVSPGETYLPPSKVSEVKKGANPLDVGEKIPGKPKVAGNSYQNDTVKKTLQSGGIVIPNSIMQSKDAKSKAAAFVAAVLKKNALKKA